MSITDFSGIGIDHQNNRLRVSIKGFSRRGESVAHATLLPTFRHMHLPTEPYVYAEWNKAQVPINSLVAFDGDAYTDALRIGEEGGGIADYLQVPISVQHGLLKVRLYFEKTAKVSMN